jgi:2,3-dihydroxyphenylpropionate 1,2-dioxygenase
MDKGGGICGVLGGALVPHAPQFFSLPDTEDKATVERVRTAMGAVGARLKALDPDLWIVIANDHANQFLLHCTPPFCFHLGAEVGGSFVGRDFRFRIASDAAMRLMLHMQSEGFDPAFTNNAEIDYAFGIPLTFLGVDAPIVPLYVNSYVPPQPPMLRCFAFGAALARGIAASGLRAVVIASGGMSHFPGTNRYSNPEVDFDRRLFEILKSGNLRQLLALEERLLDDMGNVELRSWAIAAGLLGERKPDVSAFEPSWHHTYAMLAWHEPPAQRTDPMHYPPIHPERVHLTSLLYRLANDERERRRFVGDPRAFAAASSLAPDEERALASFDQTQLLALGIHPLVFFLAQLQIEHERRQT